VGGPGQGLRPRLFGDEGGRGHVPGRVVPTRLRVPAADRHHRPSRQDGPPDDRGPGQAGQSCTTMLPLVNGHSFAGTTMFSAHVMASASLSRAMPTVSRCGLPSPPTLPWASPHECTATLQQQSRPPPQSVRGRRHGRGRRRAIRVAVDGHRDHPPHRHPHTRPGSVAPRRVRGSVRGVGSAGRAGVEACRNHKDLE
jgi:hypothetical protein